MKEKVKIKKEDRREGKEEGWMEEWRCKEKEKKEKGKNERRKSDNHLHKGGKFLNQNMQTKARYGWDHVIGFQEDSFPITYTQFYF